MIHIIGCAQGIISLHLMSTTWWVAPSISRWVWYCNHKHMSWFGWEQTCCNLVWLHQVSPGWLCGGTTNADWSFCTIRWRWQCVVVINGNVMNQSNWSPTWAEARLKQIPLEISELFPKQNLIHVQCFKNRWFHFSMYSPPLVVITLSNIWSLHWIV